MIQSSRDDLSLEATYTIDTLFHLETGYFFTWQLAARTTDRWELSYRFFVFSHTSVLLPPCGTKRCFHFKHINTEAAVGNQHKPNKKGIRS